MDVYQVGGAVRDGFLGRTIKDRDWVVVGATEQVMLDLGYQRVGADFPVFLHPESKEEYALARTERKSGTGYRGFVASTEAVTLEQDLGRRDFTVNAMALTANGELVDPYGGRADLASKCLRHVTEAFREDPLRILRGARFAAQLGFEIAEETRALMREMTASGELDTLAPERVWQELRQALNSDNPGRFITALRDCGALARLFPEVDRLFGVPQPPRYHPEIDTGEHVLLALAQAARKDTSEAVRFAVLVHDLGKGTTPAEILPSHHGHEARGVELIEAFCERLRVPRDYRELACLVSRLHTRVHRALELKPAKLMKLLDDADAWRRPERFEAFLETCYCDATGRAGWSERDYPSAHRLRHALQTAAGIEAKALAESGLQGPALGEALRAARLDAITRSGI